MQCPKCYIHYDDSDKVCPMCGHRTLIRSRAAQPNQRPAVNRPPASRPPVTNGRPATPSSTYRGAAAKPAAQQRNQSQAERQAAQKKRQQIAGIVVVVLIILMQLIIPMLTEMIDQYQNTPRSSYSNLPSSPAHMPGADLGEEGMYYESVLEGAWQIAGQESDAEMYLLVDDDFGYYLSVQAPDYTYAETGEMWLWYNAPDEELYTEPYTPDAYDSFMMVLSIEDYESTGDLPDFVAQRIDEDLLYLLLYQNRKIDTMEFIVDDYYKEFPGWFPKYFGNMSSILAG